MTLLVTSVNITLLTPMQSDLVITYDIEMKDLPHKAGISTQQNEVSTAIIIIIIGLVNK